MTRGDRLRCADRHRSEDLDSAGGFHQPTARAWPEHRRSRAKAGEIRFVPVLPTKTTAIGGLLPIAFGGSALYRLLAWVIIGGLISSMVLARLVTPVMYKLLPPARAFEPEVKIAV
jgi:hypothetical protein